MSTGIERAAPDTAVTRPGTAGTPRLVGVAWALLGINTLGSTGADTVIPLPRAVIQLVTMGALVAAFALALVLNPRLRIRPSAYVFLLTLMLVPSVISSVHLEAGLGALFRCFRLALFVATLWLLSRWWDGSLTFVRYHIRTYFWVLVTVAAGLAVAPGAARPTTYQGRLAGVLWPLTPPQIGQYAAVIIGLTVLLQLGGLVDRKGAAVVIVPSLVLLMLTHTRTATLGLLIGLALAISSLVLSSAAARRFLAWAMLAAAVAAVGFAGALRAWFRRGQDAQYFSSLTGRAKVWDALLAAHRTTSEQIFGTGLGDKSFDGLPIDNSWLAVYHEQGLMGISIVAAFLVVLLGVAVLRPPSLPRACAIFLIGYCAIASYTEAGLGDASPYLLHLALATSLLAAPDAATHLPTPAVPLRHIPRWARDRRS
jgi:O-antigen ligase